MVRRNVHSRMVTGGKGHLDLEIERHWSTSGFGSTIRLSKDTACSAVKHGIKPSEAHICQLGENEMSLC